MYLDLKRAIVALAFIFWFIMVTLASVWFFYEKVSSAKYNGLVKEVQQVLEKFGKAEDAKFAEITTRIDSIAIKTKKEK